MCGFAQGSNIMAGQENSKNKSSRRQATLSPTATARQKGIAILLFPQLQHCCNLFICCATKSSMVTFFQRMLRSQMESKIDVESVKPKTKPAATICHSSTRKASKIDARTHFSNNDREATSNSKELGVPEQFRNQDSCDIPKRSILKTAIKQREGSSTRPKIKKRVSFSLPTATGDGPHQKAKAKAKNQRKIKVK